MRRKKYFLRFSIQHRWKCFAQSSDMNPLLWVRFINSGRIRVGLSMYPSSRRLIRFFSRYCCHPMDFERCPRITRSQVHNAYQNSVKYVCASTVMMMLILDVQVREQAWLLSRRIKLLKKKNSTGCCFEIGCRCLLGASSRIVVEVSAKTPDVPYGDCFSTTTRYCMTHAGPNKTKLSILTFVVFSKSTMFRCTSSFSLILR